MTLANPLSYLVSVVACVRICQHARFAQRNRLHEVAGCPEVADIRPPGKSHCVSAAHCFYSGCRCCKHTGHGFKLAAAIIIHSHHVHKKASLRSPSPNKHPASYELRPHLGNKRRFRTGQDWPANPLACYGQVEADPVTELAYAQRG